MYLENFPFVGDYVCLGAFGTYSLYLTAYEQQYLWPPFDRLPVHKAIDMRILKSLDTSLLLASSMTDGNEIDAVDIERSNAKDIVYCAWSCGRRRRRGKRW